MVAVALAVLPITAAQTSGTDKRPRFRSSVKLTTVSATVTDADGRYQLDDVDPGTYVISFTHQTDPSYPTWYLSDSTPGARTIDR